MRIPLLQTVPATGLMASGPGAAATQSETLLCDHVHLTVPNPAEAPQWYMDPIGGGPVDGRDDRMLIGATRFIFQRPEDRRSSAPQSCASGA